MLRSCCWLLSLPPGDDKVLIIFTKSVNLFDIHNYGHTRVRETDDDKSGRVDVAVAVAVEPHNMRVAKCVALDFARMREASAQLKIEWRFGDAVSDRQLERPTACRHRSGVRVSVRAMRRRGGDEEPLTGVLVSAGHECESLWRNHARSLAYSLRQIAVIQRFIKKICVRPTAIKCYRRGECDGFGWVHRSAYPHRMRAGGNSPVAGWRSC